ncbi:hypothetical protein BFP70_06550 [Thioclava sp. SK-1]|uniref:DUF3775 domain-containing protein n=1 Tax=Thioclava sp. SK-1 TaxID=1889770 RepID=UPI0008250595|nr:DUF3775 domain-containing protein [Thioclava sp. SK-1]OCX65797.1 hypothetical protein BFP70_06550 [Thioclava sp. SK-1]
MLTLSPAKIAHVIHRARKFDSGMPGSGKSNEIRAFIAGLNDDEKAELTAVMWIGRETYDVDDFADAKLQAQSEATIPTEDYLLDNPLLSDQLEDGLNALGITLEDAEDGIYPTV